MKIASQLNAIQPLPEGRGLLALSVKAIKYHLRKYKKATLHCDRKLLYWIPLDQSVKKIFNNGQIDCVK